MDRSPARVKDRIDRMVERCRAAGLNITPQRIAIYRALLESEEHPTPEMLFRSVSAGMPSLSLATIYKTLDALAAMGLVRAVPVDSDSRRYDANDAPHHHLVCSACGSIRDYYSDEFDSLAPPRRMRGFVARSVSVNITGVCGDCRKVGKEATAQA